MFRAEKSLPGLAKNNFKQSQNLDDTKAVFFSGGSMTDLISTIAHQQLMKENSITSFFTLTESKQRQYVCFEACA